MPEDFAFMLPFSMVAFGVAFLSLARAGGRTALLWGVGFVCAGVAFVVQPPFNPSEHGIFIAIGDTLSAFAFFLFGEALLERGGRPGWALLPRTILFGAVSLIGGIAITAYGNANVEVLASDWGCMSLIALPLLKVARRMTRPLDRALVLINAVIIIDNVTRGAAAFFTEADGLLISDAYVYMWQATAAITAVLYSLTGLAAIVLDIVTGYREAALRDPLSGLLNRRGFEDAVSGTAPAAIISCDIDHFKRINDAFGHPSGDRVIARLAETIAAADGQAIAARFGGEEFVIALPGQSIDAAVALAETLRHCFAAIDWRGEGIDQPVTASFGVAGALPGDYSIHDAIARADAALYDAKRASRDCVRRDVAAGLTLAA